MAKYLLVLVTLIFSSPFIWAQELLNLAEGDARPISTKQEIGSVFITDPAIADYQVIDKNKIVVFGRGVGKAALLIFDDDGETIFQRQLVVNQSMVHIQQNIEMRYPNADVSIFNLGDKVVLSGTVATEEEKDGIYILVGELLGKPSENQDIEWKLNDNQSLTMDFMRKRIFTGVVNNIEVASTKQINVKISVAEVSHSLMQNFGLEFATSSQSSGVFVNALGSFSSDTIIRAITAINDDEIGQVLAEPNLSVISGETASFLVGGELPIATAYDDEVQITYKEFGIRLEMMAKVMRDDKIRVSLQPEVSSIDTQYGDSTYNIPAFKTRRARTTVELADGQSFVLGGLLNNEERELLRKIPYIGDIPILGSLFRYTETERNKTELLIIATVNLVKPISAEDIQLPTFQRTSNLDRFFVIPEKTYFSSKPETKQISEDILSQGGFKQ
ncbi:type II and III secretion system protein family protein [Marinomonas ostreistagni]|uniref:Pilus assembly protein N-terminal domain-containing protein n=1 Tax=Marinomonas ostreistagni TaxID=359209 RepID=A0ABS0ZDN0_9GAMM|nr:pilus assembly protein N-terminal domain-containing protein [Marinomonas ostreistagni]MBJ7551478.1 pilus assembly protein N-terminal domain-containing protein [Marinomonas ostreistagni]